MKIAVDIVSTTTKTVALDLATVVDWFGHLDDEQQAQFFVEVARRSSGWPGDHTYRWWVVTEDARELVTNLHKGMIVRRPEQGLPTGTESG